MTITTLADNVAVDTTLLSTIAGLMSAESQRLLAGSTGYDWFGTPEANAQQALSQAVRLLESNKSAADKKKWLNQALNMIREYAIYYNELFVTALNNTINPTAATITATPIVLQHTAPTAPTEPTAPADNEATYLQVLNLFIHTFDNYLNNMAPSEDEKTALRDKNNQSAESKKFCYYERLKETAENTQGISQRGSKRTAKKTLEKLRDATAENNADIPAEIKQHRHSLWGWVRAVINFIFYDGQKNVLGKEFINAADTAAVQSSATQKAPIWGERARHTTAEALDAGVHIIATSAIKPSLGS